MCGGETETKGGVNMKNRETILTAFLVEEQDRFYRLAYSYLKNKEDALDAVQTAVCHALERQNTLRDPSALRSWFGRILVNTCMDALRRQSRVVPFPEGEEAAVEDPEPEDDSLARQVEALPPEQGTVIRLRFYEELTLREISDITGCSVNTVKSRLYAALKKLRISMEGVEGA